MNLSVYQSALLKFNANVPWLKSLFFSLLFLGIQHVTFGQCNPAGNVSRFEYNVDPTSNINLTGLSFCTDQDMGTNCCGNQGSYRCVDIVINLSTGPNGELFTTNSNGTFSLTTAQGNFDALYFSVGVPNPGGNGTNCATPIGLGNNYNMMVTLTGNAMGNLEVLLTVTDNMGMVVSSTMQVASPGQSIIFTICKPGFGCGEGGEFFFGTCNLAGSLDLAPMAPSTLCEGASTELKVVAGGGTAPYTATVRCITGIDTTYSIVNIPDDGDGDQTMDMATFTVTPTGSTNHICKLVSLVDANGCVEPFNGSGLTIFVNAVTGGVIDADQDICNGGDPAVLEENTPSTGAGTLTYRWESSTTLDCETGFATIAGAEGISYDPPSGMMTSTSFRRVTISTLNGVACEAYSNCVTVTVNPGAVVDPVADQTYCPGSNVPTTVLSSSNPDAVLSWTRTNVAIGLGATNGTGNVPSFTATNAGITALSSVFSVVATLTSNGLACPGAPEQFSITVNPVPVVNAVANQTYCAGVTATSVVFSSNVGGATFAWSRTNEAIGLGATNGTDNLPSFTTTNAGSTPLTSTFSVVASYSNNGVTCPSTPMQFTITVNPTPTVAQPADQVVCNGNSTTAVVFTGIVNNTVYNWTNNNPSIGLPASGSGNFDAFPAVNNGSLPVTATITVTPTITNAGVTCPGTPASFTITVNPTPSVAPIQNISACNNVSVPITVVSGPVVGTTYAWTNNTPSIGLAANGNGNIPSFAAINNTANPVVAVITVTPTYTNAGETCQGPQYMFTITVGTTPIANAGADQSVCQSASAQLNGSGGISCSWTGAGLSNTGICNPTASPITTTTYILTVSNQDGCTDTDDVVVSIHVPEAIACNDNVQISLDENGIAEILPDHILEGTYNFDFYSVEISTLFGQPVANPVTCANVGQTLRVKVIDNCNGNFCIGTIKVEDNLSPTLVCEDVVTHCAVTNTTPAYLDGVLGLDNAYPDATDNCAINLLTYSDTWFDLDCNQGINMFDDLSAYIQRVWTARDPSGNQSSCTQYIYFERIHVYDVSFPANVTVSCENPTTDPSVTGAPFYGNPDVPGQIFPLYPGSTYCELSILYTDQLLPVCDGTYQILRTWTVYDGCLPTTPFPPYVNPMYHIQMIQVSDDQGPTITCPANITVGTNTTDCERDLNLPDVIVEDACSRINSITAQYKVNGITYTINGTLTNFPGNNLWAPDTLGVIGVANNLPLGTTEVKYIVTDDCGNSSVCTFNVTVEDLAPPAAICDEFTQVSLGINGMVFVNASTFDDGSYDNCSPVEFKARRMDANDCQDVNKFHDQVKFCCSDIGQTITVILRVYDVDVPAGDVDLDFEEDNSNDCMVQVFVEDKLKPICQAPANVTVSCENFDPSLWAYGTATAADNCCVDTLSVFNILTNFDTTCNRGTITRRWTVEDCAGLTSTCTQRIVVNYEQDYFIRFPVDKLLFSCDSSFYQEPALLGEDCELLAISYHDEIFTVVPDACFKIERTWSIINWCTYNPNAPCIYVPNPNPNPNVNSQQNLMGPTVSAPGTTGLWTPSLMRINPTDLFPTDFSTFWNPNANCYEYKQIIKVSDNIDPVFANCPVSPVEVCDLTTNHAQLWNETHWYDAATGLNDLCEAPTDLAITASDACSNQLKFRYLLFLDLDNSGDMETVINSANLPGYNNVPFGNATNPNFSGGTPLSFDKRAVPFNQKYGFTIQTVDNGGSVTASVKWNTLQSPNNYVVPEFPYGTHKIKWIAEDQCGNEKICEYTFVVKDCKAPTVVCINGLSVNIMPTQMISLWASDFLQHIEDNCTPTNQLQLGIRRKGAGTGFPTNPDGTPQTEVNFTCADLGTQFVELWGLDLAGNADYCETYLLVQDNQGFCSNDHVTVAGALKTESQSALQDAEVELNGSHPALPPINMFDQTGNDGSFVFSNTIPVAADYTVTPSLDIDHLNGVSTYDLVLINKHILGIETFGSPYKIIAADANNSKSVTTFDIAEFRKLILGIYTELPQNTSWRFVDAAYTFPTPDNPFAPAFPESKSTAAVQGNQMSDDFVAVKIGDVNQSAIANSLMTAEDRTMGTLLFDLKDQQVREGEEVVVNFTAAEKVLGYQFTLLLNGLEVLEILPGTGMTMQHFAVFDQAVTTSFDSDAQGEFTVVFRAVQSGSLRNMLGISSSITPSEAYGMHGDKLEVALRFNGSDVQGLGFELYQNQPNPFVSKTVIGFYLPEAGEATLTVFDESGRLVYTQEGDFAKGHNNVSLDRSQVNCTGILYYKLASGENSATMKMIQIK